jgi:hypothetical protein
MKNTIQKIAAILSGLLLTGAVHAQSSATPVMRFVPLLTGYNVLVTTNATVGLGVTNVGFSSYAGQILYSLTNNVINGTANTNLVAPDAFRAVSLVPDINGDLVANASVFISIGNTNLIPIAVTNSFGQYFVTNWPLALQQYPNWMYPGTTNVYPTFNAQSTNALTVTLYAGIGDIRGGVGPNQGNTFPLWESTGTFSFTVIPNGTTNVAVFTNLPIGFLQHAHKVYATISANPGGTGLGVLVNQLGILQPQ